MKQLKRCGIVIGRLVIVTVVLLFILNMIFSIQVRKILNKMKQEGRPMSLAPLLPPTVADQDNAATFYNQAFVLMTEPKDPYVPNRKGGTVIPTVAEIEQLKSFTDENTWTPEQKNRIPALVNSPEMRRIYDLLAVGSQKTICNFHRDYDRGFAMLMPELSMMRRATRLLTVRALVETQSGRTGQACDTLLLGFHMAGHLQTEPILISQLVRVACDAILAREIESIASVNSLPREKTEPLIRELAERNDDGFSRALDAERIIATRMFLQRSALAPAFEAGGDETKGLFKFLPGPLGIAWTPFLKKDCVCYLQLMDEMTVAGRLPYYAIPARQKDPTAFERRIPKYCVLTRLLLPALFRIQENTAAHQATVDLAVAGLGLNLHRSAHGGYPATLGEVTADVPQHCLIDPFTGREFVYRQSGQGFLLYSLGPNLKDDNGHRKEKMETDYDIVWEARK